ncbi:MAG: sulfite exporter TauE/SafE family protein [Desulfobacteraceae bacterium]|nr:sulfite exporter TauE/SafE family protein [Desulfobacteraceae bacterium]
MYWLALPAGVCIATIVTIVGFGGGILWMPFLLLALNMRPNTAILTSLLIQTAGTASGSIAYIRRGKTDNRLAMLLLAIAAPGVAAGALIGHRLSLSHIELVIGLISLATALLFVSVNQRYDEEGGNRADLRAALRHSWIAMIMAVASGMLTINIGEWLVPILRKKMLLKMSHAIATCILMTFGISLLGALAHLMMSSRPNARALFWAVPGVLIGGQLGPRVLMRIDERVLKEVFVFFLTIIGIHLVYSSYPL